MPNYTGGDVEDLDAIVELTRMRGWPILKKIFNEYKIDCIQKAHMHLKKHEDRKAGELLAKSNAPFEVINRFQNKKKELSNLIEKGES